jgi:hypothetical protein
LLIEIVVDVGRFKTHKLEGRCSSSSVKAVYCRTRKYQCCKRSLKIAARDFCLAGGRERVQEETGLFVLSRSSSNWMESTHVIKGHLLYSTKLDINVIQNTLTEILRII